MSVPNISKPKILTSKPKILIKTNGITGTEILVNGKKLEGVTGIRFSQSHKENHGLPSLQIDLKATEVTLDAKMLPTLPEPFDKSYISIAELLASEAIPKEVIAGICKEKGIELL